jgi:hypothetical protein
MTMSKVQLSLHHFHEIHKQHYMQYSYAMFYPKQTNVKSTERNLFKPLSEV